MPHKYPPIVHAAANNFHQQYQAAAQGRTTATARADSVAEVQSRQALQTACRQLAAECRLPPSARKRLPVESSKECCRTEVCWLPTHARSEHNPCLWCLFCCLILLHSGIHSECIPCCLFCCILLLLYISLMPILFLHLPLLSLLGPEFRQQPYTSCV